MRAGPLTTSSGRSMAADPTGEMCKAAIGGSKSAAVLERSTPPPASAVRARDHPAAGERPRHPPPDALLVPPSPAPSPLSSPSSSRASTSSVASSDPRPHPPIPIGLADITTEAEHQRDPAFPES
ncbi:hypothetical protein PVAP13_1NG552401 [Panicum virgatum]|uniref:Uncharacterized protein n=1 Tax=Panicum virgatum TaxID=38727 RepID=A0A8T0XI44_PANVG|nr:hypothetical protein PVAP13_1NG552401 [Panicum virgatum]